MIVPYLQVAPHALAQVLIIDLPLVYVPLLSYLFVATLCYLVAGLRNQQEGGAMGPVGLANVLLLPLGMCLYHLFFCVINLKAFLDEFVLGTPYRRSKTEHRGTDRPIHRAGQID